MSNSLKRSSGSTVDATLGAVTDQVVFSVPEGYKCIVYMFHLANTSGANAIVSSKWNNDGTAYTFLSGATLAANSFQQFGGSGLWLVLDNGDTFTVSCSNGHSVDVLISYELQRV